MLDLPPKIGLPAPEIIVHVNDRDDGFLRALFQARKLLRHRAGITQELVRLREIQIIDDVDEEKRDLGFIRNAPVQIWIPRWQGITKRGVNVPAPSFNLPGRSAFLLPA